MKLIVAGSTGFVATELIRQALSNSSVSSIVGLARRETVVPQNVGPGVDKAKLKSVICDDFENYSESVRQELAGADACIWLIAVTPGKLRTMPFEEATRICHDYTIAGLQTISQLARPSNKKPLRFIYTTGSNAEPDETKRPWILGNYALMRGRTEAFVLNYSKDSNGAVDASIAKMGLVDAPGKLGVVMKGLATVGRAIIGLPAIKLSEVAAALLDQAVNGLEKDTLLNDDLVRIGQRALASQQDRS